MFQQIVVDPIRSRCTGLSLHDWSPQISQSEGFVVDFGVVWGEINFDTGSLRRTVRLYEWCKAKTFCCAFFAGAMMRMVAAATIVWFPPVQVDRPIYRIWLESPVLIFTMFGEILIQINMTYFTNISCICYTIVCVCTHGRVDVVQSP